MTAEMKFAILLLCLVTVAAGAGLYPFGQSVGDKKAPSEDDQCRDYYDYSITMFGESFSRLYICTNGLISLDKEFVAHVTERFPLQRGSRTALICPYWADADVRNGGSLWSRVTTDQILLERASAEVADAYSTQSGYNATWLLIATWDSVVGYQSSRSVMNTFQAVIVSDGNTSFAMFNYEDINWFAGPSTSKPAQVGFDSGDGKNYYATNNSQTLDIVNIASQSNVGIPGKMIFMLGLANSAVTEIIIPDKPSPPTTMTTTNITITNPGGVGGNGGVTSQKSSTTTTAELSTRPSRTAPPGMKGQRTSAPPARQTTMRSPPSSRTTSNLATNGSPPSRATTSPKAETPFLFNFNLFEMRQLSVEQLPVSQGNLSEKSFFAKLVDQLMKAKGSLK